MKFELKKEEARMSSTYPQTFVNGRPSRLTTVFMGLGLACALCFSSRALAQQAPGSSSSPIFYPGPPAGFDPVGASDQELALYGFPPRPDQSQPTLYAHWQKVVNPSVTRLTNLPVQATNIINGTSLGRRDQGAVGNTTATTSNNWSGYAVTAANGTFRANNSFVIAEWMVPAVGRDNCSYAPYAASQWVGFDGFGSADVLQAGTAITACGSSYVAWYEWFTSGCTGSSGSLPCYQTNVSIPISPGDLVTTEVWYTTAAPNGHAYIVNYTTQQSTSVGFNQPSGSPGSAYVGNSAEWVVERPGLVGLGLENLANYLTVPMNFAYAYNGSSYYYPSSSPSGTTIYNITMTCPPWNPSSACSFTGLSYALLSGTYTLWFADEGAAEQ